MTCWVALFYRQTLLTTVCLQVKDCCYKQCEIGRFQPPDSTANRSSVIWVVSHCLIQHEKRKDWFLLTHGWIECGLDFGGLFLIIEWSYVKSKCTIEKIKSFSVCLPNFIKIFSCSKIICHLWKDHLWQASAPIAHCLTCFLPCWLRWNRVLTYDGCY